MKKTLYRLMALCFAAALVVGLFTPARKAEAADSGVEQYVDGLSYKAKTFTKNIKTNGVKISIEITYPYYTVKGDKDLTKAVNKVIKKNLITAEVNACKKLAKDYEKGTKLTVEATFETTDDEVRISRTGNILGVGIEYESYIEGGAFPTIEKKAVNINLRTGKKLTLKNMFNNVKKLRAAIAKQAISDFKKLAKVGGGVDADFFKNKVGTKKAAKETEAIIKNNWTLDDVMFSYDRMTIFFDETQHGIHADSVYYVMTPEDISLDYLKEEHSQLILPFSMVRVELPEHASGTGYEWEGGDVGDGSILKLECSYTKLADASSVALSGGPHTDVLVYRWGGKAGTIKLDYELKRSWETDVDPIETYSRELIVTEGGFITDVNGEGI